MSVQILKYLLCKNLILINTINNKEKATLIYHPIYKSNYQIKIILISKFKEKSSNTSYVKIAKLKKPN